MHRRAQQCRLKMLLKSGRGKKSYSFHALRSYAVQKKMSFLIVLNRREKQESCRTRSEKTDFLALLLKIIML